MINLGNQDKLVVILSGGIDSSVLLYSAVDAGKQVTLFHGYYNKPSSQHELAFAKWASQIFHLPLEIVDLSGITSMQVGYVDPIQIASDEADMKAEELNNENAISGFHTLISVAAYFTQITGNEAFALGLISEQAARRPDLRNALDLFEQFIGKLNPLAPPPTILSPLVNMPKKDVIKLGAKLGVPFDRTWSCSAAIQSSKHCGVCAQCTERKQAFADAGVVDITDYSA
ncbi:7-cyano-7-deazaguanine synthase [Rhizobium sp. WYCCWR 11146]|uniref:7-cyano-7-deazaguanine synthase n=1 Tax=Rhizobium sp. WYCCWR 11146 TaxID=2749833 RepID=UPI0015E76EE9|nr:7-cyano-7-deazaguanine synthase [Rhizobium sp. WYCCWR 11146]MBA1348562.1 7-cyano-7-deazaguanine synthase [Rhizobium sp. WYCCWR 11146]